MKPKSFIRILFSYHTLSSFIRLMITLKFGVFFILVYILLKTKTKLIDRFSFPHTLIV